ncbi:DUF924 family protein [Usitatibacter palustris]|uniref:DUF924 domain-containing protein n=1 Tax=Usitatibacter palustris TaxID=2732487 RepID=A0A6M4HBD5_9PROT|nr:DUF924 family protein [Usitatibacter palustris]QJR15794.1 hypothetical protein DSM104440_02620 [Usitatibacter palustris]
MAADYREVLQFWFTGHATRPEWFRKDAFFDGQIRVRFGELHEEAARGGLTQWEGARESALALLIVLDQFSRNLYRDDARAFAQDARARAIAESMIGKNWHLECAPVERMFVYLPLEHAEDMTAQDRAVALFAELENYPETRGLVQWAEKHRVVIRRFGRFPHRNAALGRASTPEETAFLAEPGSRF